MEKELRLFEQMTSYEKGEPQRTQHFLKVYAFARAIAELEQIEAHTRQILLAAALVHDCGIRPALAKYGSGAGEYQQTEGPTVAAELLRTAGYDEAAVARVAYLVAHHHTYRDMDGMDYQILVEADFLVNIFESEMARPEVEQVRARIFRTTSGKRLLTQMYLPDEQ